MKLLIENWRSYISEDEAVKCPPPTQDLDLNTKNRDRCRKESSQAKFKILATRCG